MLKFAEWLKLSENVDYKSAKNIIFNVLGADEKSDTVLNTPLSEFANRDKILKQSVIKNLPNFEAIQSAIVKSKITVGQLISVISGQN